VERWRVVGRLIPATAAALLAVALVADNMALALGILVVTITATLLYYEWLKERGEILSDERTVKIDEMASRRTLQVLVLVLAFSVIILSMLSSDRSELRGAYYLALGLMILVSALKLSLKYYYERVM